jgi:hypothetical protein
MSRRFQFSLRGLLGIAAVVCAAFGGIHLLNAYGSWIEVSDLAVGKPVIVKGRYIRLFGPPKLLIFIQIKEPKPKGRFGYYGSCVGSRQRRWLCLYSLEAEFARLDEPCELRAELGDFIKPSEPGPYLQDAKQFVVVESQWNEPTFGMVKASVEVTAK